MNETRYPLCWPAGWKRTPARERTRAKFGRSAAVAGGEWKRKAQLSVWDGVCRIARELRALKVDESEIIVSTNIPTRNDGSPRSDRREPEDPGVAVYWTLKGRKQCMPIDRYDRVADNLAAIAATLEALRAIERHGGGAILDRAFVGFMALPAAIVTARPWREVFGFLPGEEVRISELEYRFRTFAKEVHPDRDGGSHELMSELNAARDAALEEITE